MKEPDRVHRVYLARTFDGKENFGAYFQYTRFKDLERWTTSFGNVTMTSPLFGSAMVRAIRRGTVRAR